MHETLLWLKVEAMTKGRRFWFCERGTDEVQRNLISVWGPAFKAITFAILMATDSQEAGAIDPRERKPNRLIHEPSPYLQQHAHNPVDWYPWGDKALTKAKTENKPIFLSVGYSACHWCHVGTLHA